MKTKKGRKATPQSNTPTSASATFETALLKVHEAVYATVFTAGTRALADLEKVARERTSVRAAKPKAHKAKPSKPIRAEKPLSGVKRSPQVISEVTAKIIDFIVRRPWSTAETLASGTGLSTREIKGPLAKLKGLDPARSAPRLMWTGSKRATVYALVTETTPPPSRYGKPTAQTSDEAPVASEVTPEADEPDRTVIEDDPGVEAAE